MAHSLTTTPATATSTISTKSNKAALHVPSLRIWASNGGSKHVSNIKLVHRRGVALGVTGAVLGLNIGGQSANAAKRQPPPPPEEKKDPSVSGVQAKVLASKKRKEAMKQDMAKLREEGKAINEPSE